MKCEVVIKTARKKDEGTERGLCWLRMRSFWRVVRFVSWPEKLVCFTIIVL